MQHWSQLATRDLRTRRVRTLGAILAIALGVGSVIWVMCCYESVRQTVTRWAGNYVGKSHINVESPLGKYDQIKQALVDRIAGLENVKSAVPLLAMRLRGYGVKRAELGTHAPPDRWTGADEFDVHGIDLATEGLLRDHELVGGRLLKEGDERACVLEVDAAAEMGVGLGDNVLIWPDASDRATPIEIVGLLKHRRIARFQRTFVLMRMPALQEMTGKYALITSIDVVLNDASPAALNKTAGEIRALVRNLGDRANVRSAQARMAVLEKAQEQQEMVLQLLSSVAMLTALCIMLSTLSMGLIERVSMLGLLRCIGMTGGQLAWLVMLQVLPLGLVGILLGIPIGLGLTALTVWFVPQYLGSFAVSYNGIWLAILAGLATTVVAGLLPASAALTVSPLEASRPRARRSKPILLVMVLLIVTTGYVTQLYVSGQLIQRDTQFVNWSTLSVVLLYGTYALATPLVVWAFGSALVGLVARLMGMRGELLQDQVGQTVWRSAGICSALMVGLSLVVGLSVFNQTFVGGWEFPKKFPEAYIYSLQQMKGNVGAVVRGTAGVKNATAANLINPYVEEKPIFGSDVYRSVTWFLGCEPDTFFDMVQLEFVEGDLETAKRLLRRGDSILVAADFANTRSKAMEPVVDPQTGKTIKSDEVRVNFNDKWETFKVAGVMNSPALDVAAGYFQAETEMRVVATGSVLGTNAELKARFNVDGVRLVLLNFDLPPEPPPQNWPPEKGTLAARGMKSSYFDSVLPLERRWQRFREDRLLAELSLKIGATQARYGSIRELKDEIDAELTRVTRLLTAVPAVALIIAALGVANLMAANIANRTKELAILRAIGATRGLVLRLVIGEALVLGALGSAMGLLLGLHLSWNVTTMMVRMWGFQSTMQIPWITVGTAVLLTVGMCILAGVLPARHASRTNVIDALHVP